mgnify:CR=1 FL=1
MPAKRNQRYVHKPLDRYGFIVDVGYYKPDGTWVPAPRLKRLHELRGIAHLAAMGV